MPRGLATWPFTPRPAAQNVLVDALVQSSFATVAVLSRIAAEHDLSLTQLRVLAILRDRRRRMSALAEYLGLERSTLSGLVDRAVGRDLVARVPNADYGRVIDVMLTEHDRALAENVRLTVEDALAPLTHALSASDHDQLRQLLERMLSAHLLI